MTEDRETTLVGKTTTDIYTDLALDGQDDWDRVYTIIDRVFGKATDDPEPQADDVKTIRDALEFPYSGITLDEKKRKALAALSRLSAPVDVQTKAEEVAKVFIETYAQTLTEYETCELIRLIVEQFTRKG
jgi:hypothetical protein